MGGLARSVHTGLTAAGGCLFQARREAAEAARHGLRRRCPCQLGLAFHIATTSSTITKARKECCIPLLSLRVLTTRSDSNVPQRSAARRQSRQYCFLLFLLCSMTLRR
jgi:hypothetical protein